jgi:hypothetical protein
MLFPGDFYDQVAFGLLPLFGGHPEASYPKDLLLRNASMAKDLIWQRRDSSPLRKASGDQNDKHRRGKDSREQNDREESTKPPVGPE